MALVTSKELLLDPEAFDPKKYTSCGMAEVKAYVIQKMEVIGSTGKAY